MRPLLIVLLLFSNYFTHANFSRDSTFIRRCYEKAYGADTTVTFSNNKFHQTYNNNYKLIERISLYLIGDVWTNDIRELFNYDGSGNIIRRQRDNWNLGTWQSITLDSFQYNPVGLLILQAHYQWAGDWIPVQIRNNFTYSISDSLLISLQQVPIGLTWENKMLITHLRNIVEKDSNVLFQRWSGSAWIDSLRIIHFRNNVGTDTLILTQLWDNTNWNDIRRNHYSIDSYQRILTDTLQFYSLGAWLNNSLKTFSYNSFGYNFSALNQGWSQSDSAFINIEIIYYDIDLHHRVFGLRRYFDWDPERNYYFYSQEYYYDTLGRIILVSGDCISACSDGGTNYYYDLNGYKNIVEQWHFNMGGEYFVDICEYYYTSISSNNYICDSGFTTLRVDSAASYLWSNGETTQEITVDSTGYYQAQLTFADGVTLLTLPIQVTLLSSYPATHAIDSTVTLCNGNYVELKVESKPNTTYQWLRNDSIINDAIGPNYDIFFHNMVPGNYRMITTNPCGVDTSTTTILQSGFIPAASISGQNYICSDNSVLLIGQPSGNYTYEWTSWVLPDDTGQTFLVTRGGQFKLTITDSVGCYSQKLIYIYSKNNPSIPLIVQDANLLRVTNPSNYQIQWYLNGIIILGETSASYLPVITGLYSVSYTFNNSCTKNSENYYFNLNKFIAEAGPAIARICSGKSVVLGMNTNTGFGGTPPYIYSWSPDSSLSSPSISSPVSNPLINTAYHLTITDALGNVAHDSITVIVDSIPNAEFTSSTGSFNICSNDNLIFSIADVPGNSWNWSYDNLNLSYWNYTPVFQAGTYRLIVTSPFGCTDTSVVEVNEFDTPAPPIILTTGQTVACGGTGVSFYVKNNPALTYQWYDQNGNQLPGKTDTLFYPTQAGLWTIQITDSNHCYSSTYQNYSESTLFLEPITISDSNFCNSSSVDLYTDQVNGFTYQWYWNGYDIPAATTFHYQTSWPGSYIVNCIDTNGCIGTAMVELYNIFPSDSLHIEAYGSDLWARGPKNNIQWYFNSVLIPGAIDTLFHPLNTGIYTVKNILNTNFGSCGTLSKPFEVFCSVTIQQTNVPCDHSCVGEAIVHINSHATPTISWSNGSSDSLIQQLCEGMYIVSVNDSAGCNVVDSVKIIIDNPVVLNTVAYGSHCFNECNGSLYLFPSGGNGIYTWKINNIDTTIISYNSICAGDYLIQLNDSAGCVDSKMVTISNPSPIIISQTSLIEPTCSGSCDGEIVVFVSGGVGNYYPRWVDIGFGYTHYSLCDTDYVFTVSDQNNCIEIDTFSISAALNLQNNLNVTAPTCVNSCDGQITITTTNGTLPYSYSWSNGQTGSTVSACTGNLTFTVTDSIGCNLTESVYLPPQDSVYFNLSIRGTNCIGCSDGKIYINPVSAHSPYSITWLPSIGVLHNDTISNLLAGNYFVCLTDNNSCVFCDSVFIMEDPTTISDLKSFSLINISPNPFHEYTTVTFSHSETDIYTISLKDISGRIIREYKNIPETINIGGAGLAVGFYFISILKNGRLQWNEKVLVY